MKTVTVEFPIEEAVDILRLLRSESRCLIENGDVMPDIDVVKRAQNVLSARERIVTSLEEIAGVEQEPMPLPDYAMNLTAPQRPHWPQVDDALAKATSRKEDIPNIALRHGVPHAILSGPQGINDVIEAEWAEEDRVVKPRYGGDW